MGYGHEEFGYRLWDLVTKKIVRSRDVVFLEDQLVSDDDKVEKASSSAEIPVRLDTVPPVVPTNHGGEVQEDDGDTGNEDAPIVDDVEPAEQVDEELPLPPVEAELRRSTRERKLPARYSSHEYVMLTDAGEAENYQEAMLLIKRKNG